jgi:hypothetical protein
LTVDRGQRLTRAGALDLLGEGDFGATIDLERAEEHCVFELVVDWECFHQKRINLRFVGGERRGRLAVIARLSRQ